MRIGDHDPDLPEDRDDGPDAAAPPAGAPRFARLVRGRAARRLSPRRLAVGLLVGALVVGVVGWGCVLGVRWLADRVAARPEHQVRFDAIEFVPPPPPYIARGAAGILDDVRREGRYGETIPVLATDLEALRVDLKRNHWLEDVPAVRASYGRLVAEVVYRRPLALIEVETRNEGTVIDRHGVELPTGLGQFARSEDRPGRYRPAGEPRPLVTIRGLGLGVPDREGRVWKSTDPAVGEGRVLEAARLAEEVAARAGAATPGKRPMPDFFEVLFRGEGAAEAFALFEEGGRNEVRWGSAPGREAADEPPAARKWELLARFIDESGAKRLDLAPGVHLKFRFDRAVPARATPRAKSR